MNPEKKIGQNHVCREMGCGKITPGWQCLFAGNISESDQLFGAKFSANLVQSLIEFSFSSTLFSQFSVFTKPSI